MRGFVLIRYLGYLAVIAALLLLAPFRLPALAASDEDIETLGMYYEANDLVVSATRNPILLSQSPENITIITARDIEMMGAHTLVDVLANVPGIQASDMGGPGLFNELSIDGANANHILVLLDGVTVNLTGNAFVDVSGFPLQNIERVEIVKGPGSSSWGSALGAVINIVTKSPLEGKYLGGTLSFSGGERSTRDTRGELSGTIAPLGYYLYAGNLTSHGFRPNSGADQNDFYAKLRWELPKGSLQATIAYDRGIAGEGDGPRPIDLWKFRRRTLLSTLSFNYPISDKIDFDLSLRSSYKSFHEYAIMDARQGNEVHETDNGGSVKLSWRERLNSLTVGYDYDHLNAQDFGFHLYSDKHGLFLNDTFSLGDLSITAGVRYDKMRPVGDFFSPSAGVAWNPTGKITLRGYWANGFSLPLLCPVRNASATQQKVTTFQAGLETTYIPWLWLKSTFFWNQLADVQLYDPSLHKVVFRRQLKQGVEVEGKTVPLFNTSFSAGYTLIDATDRDTIKPLMNNPWQIVKLGVHYDDPVHDFRGSLLGRWVWYNASASLNTKDKAFIWDLNLAKKVLNYRGTDLDLFFNVHNLFNGAQYITDDIQNARRWVEGGIKFNF